MTRSRFASLLTLLLALPALASTADAQDLRIRIQVEGADAISAPRPAATEEVPAATVPAPAEGTVYAVPRAYGQLPAAPNVRLRAPVLDAAASAEWATLQQRYRKTRLGGGLTMLILGANITWIGGWLSAVFSWTDDCWDCVDEDPTAGELGFAMFASAGAALFITGLVTIIRRVVQRRRVRRDIHQFRLEHGLVATAW